MFCLQQNSCGGTTCNAWVKFWRWGKMFPPFDPIATWHVSSTVKLHQVCNFDLLGTLWSCSNVQEQVHKKPIGPTRHNVPKLLQAAVPWTAMPKKLQSVFTKETWPERLHLRDLTWKTSPERLDLKDFTWETWPERLHLRDFTLERLHLRDFTWKTSPERLHLKDFIKSFTWQTSTERLHLSDFTWESSPKRLHLIDFTWETSPNIRDFTSKDKTYSILQLDFGQCWNISSLHACSRTKTILRLQAEINFPILAANEKKEVWHIYLIHFFACAIAKRICFGLQPCQSHQRKKEKEGRDKEFIKAEKSVENFMRSHHWQVHWANT